MTVTIDVTPGDEQELTRRAASRGLDVAAYVSQLIRRDLESVQATPHPNQAALDLLARWDKEDETNDPAELERRQREWEDFRRSMNENSLSDRPVYP